MAQACPSILFSSQMLPGQSYFSRMIKASLSIPLMTFWLVRVHSDMNSETNKAISAFLFLRGAMVISYGKNCVINSCQGEQFAFSGSQEQMSPARSISEEEFRFSSNLVWR